MRGLVCCRGCWENPDFLRFSCLSTELEHILRAVTHISLSESSTEKRDQQGTECIYRFPKSRRQQGAALWQHSTTGLWSTQDQMSSITAARTWWLLHRQAHHYKHTPLRCAMNNPRMGHWPTLGTCALCKLADAVRVLAVDGT